MSEYTNERLFDSATDLNLIREQCGTLELALQGKTDPARLSDFRRKLAEWQRAFEIEQRDQPAAEGEAGGPVVLQAGDYTPALVEPAEQHEARLLACDETFFGEVVV